MNFHFILSMHYPPLVTPLPAVPPPILWLPPFFRRLSLPISPKGSLPTTLTHSVFPTAPDHSFKLNISTATTNLPCQQSTIVDTETLPHHVSSCASSPRRLASDIWHLGFGNSLHGIGFLDRHRMYVAHRDNVPYSRGLGHGQLQRYTIIIPSPQ